MSTNVFKSSDLGLAFGFAAVVEAGLVVLLMLAGSGTALSSEQARAPREIPIAVTPVVEDLPLLKYGKPEREQALPDMWRKPKPKKRYEDKSAPSVSADKNPTTLPTNEVAKRDETPAPEDAEIAKKVDEDIVEEETTDDPNPNEEGHVDGVIGGTEVDALKAFVISQYKAKLISWFKQGFVAPQGAEFCDITALVVVSVAGDRTVTSYSLQSSGNSTFDAKVRAHMDRKVGQKVPPPPPKHPELGEKILKPRFSGENSACKNKSRAKTPQPDDADDSTPPAPVPNEPAPAPAPPALDDSVDGLLE